jgi:hypothetical protein
MDAPELMQRARSFRSKAIEMRRRADRASPLTQDALLDLARTYDGLASEAEQLARTIVEVREKIHGIRR